MTDREGELCLDRVHAQSCCGRGHSHRNRRRADARAATMRDAPTIRPRASSGHRSCCTSNVLVAALSRRFRSRPSTSVVCGETRRAGVKVPGFSFKEQNDRTGMEHGAARGAQKFGLSRPISNPHSAPSVCLRHRHRIESRRCERQFFAPSRFKEARNVED